MMREITSGLLIVAYLACSVPVLDNTLSEICVAVMTPDRLGRDLTPLESFIAANTGSNFGKLCE